MDSFGDAPAVLQSPVQGYIVSNQFGAVGASQAFTVSAEKPDSFSFTVNPNGNITSWSVNFDLSIDGQNWTTLMTHTNTNPGAGKIVASGAQKFLAAYVRFNCTELVLGSGTSITALAAAR